MLKHKLSFALVNVIDVNKPLYGGIVAPVNENPTTVIPPAETENPLVSAIPPDAPVIDIPGIANWNPATSSSLFIIIS